MTDAARQERRVRAIVAALMRYYQSSGRYDHGLGVTEQTPGFLAMLDAMTPDIMTEQAREFVAMLDAITPADMRWTPDE